MSPEPQCHYCNHVDKGRCRTDAEAFDCKRLSLENKAKLSLGQKVNPEKNMNIDNVKKLNQLSTRTARSVMAVIDAMAQRGAFKGEELMTIGGLRNDCAEMMRLSETVENELEEDGEDQEG